MTLREHLNAHVSDHDLVALWDCKDREDLRAAFVALVERVMAGPVGAAERAQEDRLKISHTAIIPIETETPERRKCVESIQAALNACVQCGFNQQADALAPVLASLNPVGGYVVRAETPAPEPTPLANQPFTGRRRDIQTLHDVVALLARTIWDKQVPAGKHLWSIPVDKERDFDCILSDAIDELEWLRAQSAPVVAAPAPTPQDLRAAIARLYWTIPAECADARRELRAFEELLLPRTRIEPSGAPTKEAM
jgi:hypothetical protein